MDKQFPKLKYVGDTGPDPEEEEDGAGPWGQRGLRHQPYCLGSLGASLTMTHFMEKDNKF